MPRAPDRILIIGPSNIGDALLASPVVDRVRQRYPEAHLTVVTGERARPLFADDQRIQTVVDASQFESPIGRVRLAVALWRYRPQMVVDLRHTLFPLLLKPLAMWRYLRQPGASVPHMRDRHLWKLRAQAPAFREAMPEPAPWTSARDAAHVDGLWRRWQLDAQSSVVVICPGARSLIKRWTAAGFAEVAERLLAGGGRHVLFAGEPDEKPIVDEILGLMRHPAHSAIGLTTVRQLGIVMQRARLVITNDSAALHLASQAGAPTLAIFGPTDPVKYGPTSPRRRTIRRELFCSPCERPLCRFNHECMRFISADEVYGAAIALLSEAPANGRA
jgi:ADP-heptose:LPS heptosyltransferase